MAEAAEKIDAKESWNVYQLVAAVQADLSKKGIGKEQTNTFDKYKFRGIDDVYNALGPVLSRHGLVIFPEVKERSVTERQSQKGGALFHVTLDVVYHFVSAHDGSEMLVPVPGEAMDRGDKAINKAMSAAYKLACFQTFCIPIEGQDTELESHEVKRSTRVVDAALDGVTVDLVQKDDYVSSIRAAVFNEDNIGLAQLLDEVATDHDMKLSVWAELDSQQRRYIKEFERDRNG